MRRGHKGKVDANHPEIVRGLRKIGATVQSLAEIGHGCPDILVGHRGKNYVFEIKPEVGSLTDAEMDWMGAWRGDARVIRSLVDALTFMEFV